MLTYQDRIHAGLLESEEVVMAVNAAFTDDEAVLWYFLTQSNRMLQVGMKRAQVAIVDADQTRAGIQDARQVLRFVEFDQGCQSEFDRFVVQFSEITVVQTFGN